MPDPAPPADVAATPTGGVFALRREIPLWASLVAGALCIAAVFAVWYVATAGPGDQRYLSPAVLPSPSETFSRFESLWFERALTRNVLASLRRVALGFLLATVVGVPIGVLCGCFAWAKAFFMPVIVFGRNIPIAALIPITFSLFGIYELQKVMFIFIATVAFVIADTADSIADVSERYVDTAYTLGASRVQVILKVLVPLALPNVFNSLRLLFGLAFGYVMLAELVTVGNEAGGLGHIINLSQRRGQREDILLVLMVIPLIALAIDRVLYWIQCELFPYRYGGPGVLRNVVAYFRDRAEDAGHFVFGSTPAPALGGNVASAADGPSNAGSAAGPTGKEPLMTPDAVKTLSDPTDRPAASGATPPDNAATSKTAPPDSTGASS